MGESRSSEEAAMASHQQPDFPPVRACLFDMDGLLLNTEDIYSECANIILHKYGRPSLPWHIKAQLQGRPGPEAGQIFSRWAQLPITWAQFLDEQSSHQARLFPHARPLPGVTALLETLSRQTSPRTHIALATSSHRRNFNLKTAHLSSLFGAFPPAQTVLGDDPRIPAGKGKPAPDIYLLALRTVNEAIRRANEGKVEGQHGWEPEVVPAECLVFEDSVPGVEAGRRAGMRVVWCPHPELLREYRGREKEVLAGRTGMCDETARGNREKGEGQEVVKDAGEDVAGKERKSGQKVRGGPGEIDDGSAELLETLEDFPYKRYGITVVG